MKNTIKKILLVTVGTLVAAFGIDLAIHASFGGATLAVLWEGCALTFHITMGQASFLIAAVMLLFCFFYDRKQIGWGTVIYQILYSTFVDVFEGFLVYTDSRIANFGLMVLGIVLLSVGCGIYSYADWGRGSYEALTFALVNRRGWQTQYVRIGLDICCVAVGAVLGGKFGWCTVVTVLLSGVILQRVVGWLRRVRFLGLEQ